MLTDCDPGNVVAELANMLCGTLVSNLDYEGKFDLSAPELIPIGNQNVAGAEDPPTSQQNFELQNGTLTVTLRLGTGQ